MNNLEDWEILYVANGVGKKLFKNSKNKIHKPVYANGRKDICAVKYEAVDGSGIFQVVFLIWKDAKNCIYYMRIDDLNKELLNNINHDFVGISDVNVNSGNICIKISSGGSSSGKKSWDRTVQIPMVQINRLEC